MRCLSLWLSVILLSGMLGCSSAKEDYANLERVLSSNEQLLQGAHDFDSQQSICRNSITAIEQYLKVHSEGEWSETAESALTHWQQRLEEVRRLEKKRVEELPKVEYVIVEQLLTSNEQVFQSTHDFDTQIDLCKNAIAAVEEYLTKHANGEWPAIARAALSNWQQRLEKVHRLQTQLTEELHALLKTRSEDAAQKHHPLSKIEETKLVGSVESKQSANKCITDTYEIKMPGSIIGHSVFRLTAEAKGCIVSTTRTVESSGEVTLQE